MAATRFLFAIKALISRPARRNAAAVPNAGDRDSGARGRGLPGLVEIQMQDLIEPLSHERKIGSEARKTRSSSDLIIAIANKNSNGKQQEKQDERNVFCRIQDAFRLAARRTSGVLGSAWAFMIAVAIIVVWGLTGHVFHYSDTWQLIINTGTTIVTFLMVFLIQNTQNRDAKAIQLKLDELIRAVSGARNRLMDLETLSDEDLQKFQKEFERLRKRSEGTTAETVDNISRKANSS